MGLGRVLLVATVAALLSLPCGVALRAQDAPAPPAPPAAEAQEPAEQAIQIAQEQAEQSEVARQAVEAPTPQTYPRLQGVVRGPGSAAKALVIRSSDLEAKAQVELEEDLMVMGHILGKAVNEKLGADRAKPTAMGINLWFAEKWSPVRSLYLDGYGALFFLNVKFPLLAPPAAKEAQKEKAPVDSTWAEARRELYGHPNKPVFEFGPFGPAEEYSEEKVSKLEQALVEALRNAANIRELKPDESVTVCVFGGANARTSGKHRAAVRSVVPGSAPGEVNVIEDEGTTPAKGTIMTIRVKKSEVEAFAKGKLSLEEFRKKAKVTTYLGDTDGSVGMFGFSNWSGGSIGFGGGGGFGGYSGSSGFGGGGGGGATAGWLPSADSIRR